MCCSRCCHKKESSQHEKPASFTGSFTGEAKSARPSSLRVEGPPDPNTLMRTPTTTRTKTATVDERDTPPLPSVGPRSGWIAPPGEQVVVIVDTASTKESMAAVPTSVVELHGPSAAFSSASSDAAKGDDTVCSVVVSTAPSFSEDETH